MEELQKTEYKYHSVDVQLTTWDSEGRELYAPMRAEAESGLVICPRCGCAVSGCESDVKQHEDFHAYMRIKGVDCA